MADSNVPFKEVEVDASEILDWPSFHSVFAKAFGFPAFYGRNLNAWIDCLTYVEQDDGMSAIVLAPGESLDLLVRNGKNWGKAAPDVVAGFSDAVDAVNQRISAAGADPRIRVTLQ